MSGSRVVVVGGGVAGIEIATRLGRRRDLEVTLVDKSLSHVWKPMLHGFAAGTARPDRERVNFLAHAKRHGYRFRPGTLATVDRGARTVTCAAFDDPERRDAPIGYDALVLAIGSRANDFGTEGVAEHCCFIDDLDQALDFHDRLRTAFFRAVERDAEVGIAIVGGGATGVELAAELKRALDLVNFYAAPAVRGRMRLCLIESGPRLLGAFPERVSDGAATTLRQLGVDVRVGAQVTSADAGGFSLKDGTRIEAELLVWAAGVKAPEVLGGIEGLERDRTGRLSIRPSLQATRDDAVFAVGDCASLVEGGSGKSVPATAQAARQQALHLARSLPEWLRSGEAKGFAYHDKGSIVSLADYNGWGTLGKATFGGGWLQGLAARVAHDLLYRQHQLEVHGIARGALVWLVDDLDRAISPKVRLD